MVSLRRALVPKLGIVVAVELLLKVALRVLAIVAAELDILVKLVARSNAPDAKRIAAVSFRFRGIGLGIKSSNMDVLARDVEFAARDESSRRL